MLTLAIGRGIMALPSEKQYTKIDFVYDENLNKLEFVEAEYNGVLYFAYGVIPESLLGQRFGTRVPRGDEVREVKGYATAEWFAVYEGGMLSPNPILYKALGISDTSLAEYKCYDYESIYIKSRSDHWSAYHN
jgi:hypothetical protein